MKFMYMNIFLSAMFVMLDLDICYVYNFLVKLNIICSSDTLIIAIKMFAWPPCYFFKFYIKLTSHSFIFLLKSFTFCYFRSLYKVALVLLPSYKVVPLSCCYYWMAEIRKYKVDEAFYGIKFILDVVKICQLVQKLRGGLHTGSITIS
jgi:hypothetical protein